MGLFKFSRVPKHQQFEYKPRFFDPEKEELEKRLKSLEDLNASDTASLKDRISTGLRRKGVVRDGRPHSNQLMRSNILLLAIVIFLALATLFLLDKYLPRLLQFLE